MQKYLPSSCFRRVALVVPILLLALRIADTSDAATITYLINFGDSTYTSDGANTWNAPTVTFFENVTTAGNEISLVDTSNADHGLDLAVTARGATQGGWINYTANSQAAWPSVPWFNSTVASQRAYLNVWNGSDETWVISGFDPTDQVSVQWIAQHHQNTNTRTATFFVAGITSNVISGSAVSSLNYDTRQGFQDTSYLEWNVTPSGAGELTFAIDPLNNSAFSSWGNAMRIQVTTLEVATVPEPSTCALTVLGLAGLGLAVRLRKKSV